MLQLAGFSALPLWLQSDDMTPLRLAWERWGGVFFIEWHENWINLSVYIETTWSRHYIVIFYNPSFCVYTVDG